MKIEIKHTFDLSKEEIEFLKQNFLNRRTFNYVGLAKQYNDKMINFKLLIEKLEKMGIIRMSQTTMNIELTEIGNLVIDTFDRKKKLNDLLR